MENFNPSNTSIVLKGDIGTGGGKVGSGYRFAHDTLRQYLARSAPDTVGGAKGGEGQAAA